MRNVLAAAAVIACLVFTWPVETPSAAPKPANPAVNFTFRDLASDRIRSDGQGSYVNGVGGMEGQIYANGSRDATLNLNRTRPKRVFTGEYDGAEQPSGTPDGSFEDGWFINIHDIWNMTEDETKQTLASFTTGVGDFRWCGDGAATNPGWCRGFIGSNWVTVTRTTQNRWDVTAESATNMPNLLLQQFRNQLRDVGNYDMPFGLSIDLVQ